MITEDVVYDLYFLSSIINRGKMHIHFPQLPSLLVNTVHEGWPKLEDN